MASVGWDIVRGEIGQGFCIRRGEWLKAVVVEVFFLGISEFCFGILQPQMNAELQPQMNADGGWTQMGDADGGVNADEG